ncbi:hypothetical protein H8356DRAFT_1346330 [Neocallimastix lanati (nom. inval.)]|nr:hypothetical protein H8356DRAFT_1346330 [Neocallimastix sp. JGI-2020a]
MNHTKFLKLREIGSMSGVQFHLTTHYNPFDSLTLNRTSHRLHYDRASQFGVIPAYCKSSLVNVSACSSRLLCAIIYKQWVLNNGSLSVDAEMVWHGSTLLYPDTPAINIKRVDIKEKVYQHKDQINRVRNGKLLNAHVYFFECKVFFHNRFKHGNFDKNTKPCTFFGYSFDSHGYDVLDITSKSIIIIYDTYFNKNNINEDKIKEDQNFKNNKNNEIHISKSNFNNYIIINQKLIDIKIENNIKIWFIRNNFSDLETLDERKLRKT